MHGSFDESPKTIERLHRKWGIGIVALPLLLLAVLMLAAVKQPNVPTWISEAAQAEFVPSGQLPQPTSAEIPRRLTAVKTVKAN